MSDNYVDRLAGLVKPDSTLTHVTLQSAKDHGVYIDDILRLCEGVNGVEYMTPTYEMISDLTFSMHTTLQAVGFACLCMIQERHDKPSSGPPSRAESEAILRVQAKYQQLLKTATTNCFQYMKNSFDYRFHDADLVNSHRLTKLVLERDTLAAYLTIIESATSLSRLRNNLCDWYRATNPDSQQTPEEAYDHTVIRSQINQFIRYLDATISISDATTSISEVNDVL